MVGNGQDINLGACVTIKPSEKVKYEVALKSCYQNFELNSA